MKTSMFRWGAVRTVQRAPPWRNRRGRLTGRSYRLRGRIMARRSLRPHLNQIRGWVRPGRTDAWIAHQLEVTVKDIEAFKRQNELLPDGETADVPNLDFDDEIDLRAEDDALIAKELEAAEAAREEAERGGAEEEERRAAEEEARRAARAEEGGDEDEADRDGDDDARAGRRRGRRGGRGRRRGAAADT